jgi:hypothetical protein
METKEYWDKWKATEVAKVHKSFSDPDAVEFLEISLKQIEQEYTI